MQTAPHSSPPTSFHYENTGILQPANAPPLRKHGYILARPDSGWIKGGLAREMEASAAGKSGEVDESHQVGGRHGPILGRLCAWVTRGSGLGAKA